MHHVLAQPTASSSEALSMRSTSIDEVKRNLVRMFGALPIVRSATAPVVDETPPVEDDHQEEAGPTPEETETTEEGEMDEDRPAIEEPAELDALRADWRKLAASASGRDTDSARWILSLAERSGAYLDGMEDPRSADVIGTGRTMDEALVEERRRSAILAKALEDVVARNLETRDGLTKTVEICRIAEDALALARTPSAQDPKKES